MQPIGSDRVRVTGERIVLLSSIPKGWTARTPRQGTHAEYPGTAVLWEERYFEVVEAAAQPNGAVRYVLLPWREDHTIRTFEAYDEASEARRHADHAAARKQREASAVTRLAGVLLGHLPAPVQMRLENELGVIASRMTLVSCVPPMVFAGVCVYVAAGARVAREPSPIPGWVYWLCALFVAESFIRFFVAMSQHRPMGSLLGTTGYVIYYYVLARDRAKLPSPFEAKGESASFSLPPPEEISVRDELELKAPLLTLLSPAEQQRLAERHGWDYRRHARAVAWFILATAAIGVVSMFLTFREEGRIGALVSMLVAALLALEQVHRLIALRRGPAGSVLAVIARPFTRGLVG